MRTVASCCGIYDAGVGVRREHGGGAVSAYRWDAGAANARAKRSSRYPITAGRQSTRGVSTLLIRV